jgi:hypothetical protein
MKIATGQPEDHPTPLPLDASGLPGVAPPTVTAPGSDSPANAGLQVGGVRDLTGERLSQLAAGEADWAAAMSAGMSADADRRAHYAAAMAPLGASATDEIALPAVPEDATSVANDFLYSQGDQPGA